MSKHALIITAYQDFDFLKSLCNVYAKYFRVYIHIDKKSKISEEDLSSLNQIKNVVAISRYKINWGSFYHIQAILDLLEMAKNEDNQFMHVLSANTILTKHPDKLFKFFDKFSDDIFMEIKHDDGTSFREFEYRYYGYFFQHIYNLRGKLGFLFAFIEDKLALLQAKLKLRRNVCFDWKGYVYCHLPLKAVEFLFDYLERNPKYLKEIKYSYVGEEFFFQNVFMHSAWKNKVHNDTLIYDIWSAERGYPAELNLNDLEDIIQNDSFFARKVSAKNKALWKELQRIENF